jgi:hypothetical protein
VLPPNGVGNYFILYKGSGNSPKQKSYSTLGDLALGIRTLTQQRKDVWVAVGAYGTSRTIDQCIGKSCLYADFDCGPTKTYKTKKDILAALFKAVSEGKLIEPTLILDSGNGIHLYWILDGVHEPGEWRSLAFKLKRAFELAELDADSKVTTDLARVLRPPETLNWKDGQNPRPVKALGFKAENVYTSAHLHLMLPPMEESEMDRATQAKAKLSNVTPMQISASIREMDDLIAGATGPLDNLPDHDKERLIQQMLDTLSLPRYYDDYNQWVKVGRALQDAVLLFDDPKAYEVRLFDMWDEWSQQSPSYQPDWKHPQSTSSKWAGEFPKMQTIGVGSLVYLAKQEGFVFSNAKHEVDYPAGYIAADFGTLREAGDGEDSAALVFEAHLVNGRVSADPLGGGFVFRADVIRFCKGANGVMVKVPMPFETTTIAMNSGTELKLQLGAAGINCTHPKAQMEATNFVKAFMDQVIAVRGIGRSVTRYGWVEQTGKWGFCAGSLTYWDDGTETESSIREVEFREYYQPKGQLKHWQQTAQALLDQGRPQVALTIATAFAAPLLGFTGVTGTVFSLMSQDSGTGKSVALRAAQSAWGSPQRGINVLDDTANAVTRRLEVLQHLPAYWDELRVKEQVKQFTKTVFQLSQGKGKSRMNSAAALQPVGTWETMIVVAGNEPLVDIVNDQVGSTNAGALRVIEFDMPPIPKIPGVSKLSSSFRGFESHYGHAGATYGKLLATNRDMAIDIVNKVKRGLEKAVNAQSDERFWIGAMTSVLAGAILANKWGLLQFNLRALEKFVIKTILRMRIKVIEKSGTASAITLIEEFLTEYTGSGLHTDQIHLNPGAGKPKLVTLRRPMNPAGLRLPIAYQRDDNSLLVLNKHVFDRFLESRNRTPSTTHRSLKDMGAEYQHRITLGAGAGVEGVTRSRTVVLRTHIPVFSDLVTPE